MMNSVNLRDCSMAISVLMRFEIRNETFNVRDFDIKLLDIADKIAREIKVLNGKDINIDVKSWEERHSLILMRKIERYWRFTGNICRKRH